LQVSLATRESTAPSWPHACLMHAPCNRHAHLQPRWASICRMFSPRTFGLYQVKDSYASQMNPLRVKLEDAIVVGTLSMPAILIFPMTIRRLSIRTQPAKTT
jgi:hypothetical protein